MPKWMIPDETLPQGMTPPLTHCLYHRCERHLKVPQLNGMEGATDPEANQGRGDGSECGACIGEELMHLDRLMKAMESHYAERVRSLMDVLAAYLRQSAFFKGRLLQRVCDELNERCPPDYGDIFIDELLIEYRDVMKLATEPRVGEDGYVGTIDQDQRSGEGAGEDVRSKPGADRTGGPAVGRE